jgi:hypothetical protein
MEDETRLDVAVKEVVARFCTQNGWKALEDGELARFTEMLRVLGDEIAGKGYEGELPEAVVKLGVARLRATLASPRDELVGMMKALIKGAWQTDAPVCRESYHEQDASGRCRRQELEYDRARVSGAHCVDCPYWLIGDAAEHGQRLESAWHAGAAAWAVGRAITLPEDFRAMRKAAQAYAAAKNGRQ